ncbi:uncharacterized mitochondrial protein AtMg00810-like [Cannabis sativa]|uniref:uncharacterized mitochondrial protein AtMg00810-like n=1 Tax=Cannabis sativa TaxID=3483 RepID=UPI0029CA2C33|nr:uncharacterized mitochondrial protein AtMg00810-like [Cannabis sativa]
MVDEILALKRNKTYTLVKLPPRRTAIGCKWVDPKLISHYTVALNAKYALKDLGDLHFFLGIKVTSTSGGLHLSQAKCIRDLLHKAKMDEAKPSNTPMVSGLKLSAYGSSLVDNPHMYKSIVRVLQYLVITRLEISFSVNKVCQLMANPLQSHWHVVKRILRYLSGTIDYGIHLIKLDHLDLTAFCDADWATDLDDKCSNSGFTIFFGCNLIAWQCNKQHIVSRSSTEAEF